MRVLALGRARSRACDACAWLTRACPPPCLSRAQFAAVSRDLNQIFFEFPFAVPEYFALITRALIVLEGIALTGDKSFDLFQAAYPLAAQHAARLFGAKELASMLGEAAKAERSLRELAAASPAGGRSDAAAVLSPAVGAAGASTRGAALKRTLTVGSRGASTSWC